jgi:predicted metalloprotease with PDZ domain
VVMRSKLAWVLSLALLSGGVFAQSGSVNPPAPPPPPNESDESQGTPDSDVQAQLEDARKRLEEAAHQVAELSAQAGRPFIQRFSKTDAPFGRVIIGVDLDPASGSEGARVLGVSPGGPAAEAGIRSGDVIVAVNGKDVTGAEAPRRVVKIIRDVKPDDKLVVRVVRAGSARVFSITPRERPDVIAFGRALPELPILPPLSPTFLVNGPLSNMELATLTPHLGKYFGTEKGVLVVRAPSDGLLKLEDGDVILAIDGREPSSGSHATRILGSYQPGEKITLRIVREHKTLELQATIPESHAFEYRRDSLPAANAQGRKAVPSPAALELMDQLRDQYGAGGAHRMAQGNAATIGVRLVRIEAQLGGHRAGLCGEGFI